MKKTFPRSVAAWAFLFTFLGTFASAASTYSTEVIVSVPDQVLALVDQGRLIARYPVSTSNLESAILPAVTARLWALCLFRPSSATTCLRAQSSKIASQRANS
jgi:hypothetical protein